jgi:MarR family transcriptional regulator for hemolysin
MSTKKSDELQRDFGYRIALISRRLRRVMDREFRVYGLTEATWRPLTYVKQMGDGVRQKTLAVALGIEGPSLVALLDNLEKRGLIERRNDPTDKRAYEIHMTEEGWKLCDWVGRVSARVHEAMFSEISERDQQICKRALTKVEQSLDALLEADLTVDPEAAAKFLDKQTKTKKRAGKRLPASTN